MVLGSLVNGVKWMNNPYKFFDDLLQEHGLTTHVNLPGMGKVLLTGDPDLVASIMKNNQLIGGKKIEGLRAVFGRRSLIMKHGNEHRERRLWLAKYFNEQYINAYDEIIISAIEKGLRDVKSGVSFSAHQLLQKIALRVILQLLFCQKQDSEANQIQNNVHQYMDTFNNPFVLFLKILHVNAGRFSPWGRVVYNRDQVYQYIEEQIDLNLESSQNIDDSQICLLRDLIQDCGDEQLPLDEIAAEIFAIIIFGHDTAASTMAWVMAHIYQDQDVANKIREEAKSCLKEDGSIDVEQHKYLRACIMESMRMAPVVTQISRVAEQDTMVGDYSVKSGQMVMASTYLAQHNPDIFPQPNEFKPERFLNGNNYDQAYFPFGFGNRLCIGKPFAIRQMILMLSIIVREMDLELEPGYQPLPTRKLVIIVPSKGAMMVRKG